MRGTVLFVDDEPEVLQALARCVTGVTGVEVLTSDDPLAALELLAKRHVDDVVADQRMPEMDGMEFLERVKERHPDTVRMMLTGHGDPDTLTTAINRGRVKEGPRREIRPSSSR